MTQGGFSIREAIESDEALIAEHLRRIAIELGTSPDSIREDWLEKTLQFIERARRELRYRGFVADIEGEVIASTSCQVLELYPMVSQEYQKGYIWGVYVEPAYRRQGIATKLMREAVFYLKQIGCTKVVLHASNTGRFLYAKLGYIESNEMSINL